MRLSCAGTAAKYPGKITRKTGTNQRTGTASNKNAHPEKGQEYKIKGERIYAGIYYWRNGIGYILGEDDLYYPDIWLPESTNYPIGRYWRMRKEYLKKYRKSLYLELLLSGRLNEYLH